MDSFRPVVMVVATLVYASVAAQTVASAQARGGSCPLTEAQVDKSIEAFAPIARFLTSEPRCVNCHGGVNPFIKGTGLEASRATTPASTVEHGGGAIRRSTDSTVESECRDCHNHMVRKRDGSESNWFMAPDFLSFAGKDATTLCRQVKRATKTATEFLGHLQDDNGGNAFGPTAFKGDRGLDPDIYGDLVQPAPPKLSHAALMQLGQAWVAAMGGSFKGDESCGCEHKHDKWSGRIVYSVEDKTDHSHWEQQDSNSFSFSQVTLTFTNGVGSADSHAETSAYSENRRPVVRNGQGSFEFEESQSFQGSMNGRSEATVEVNLLQDGTYRIKPGWSLPAPGKETYTVCVGVNRVCKSETRDLHPNVGAVTLSDRITDPNHLTGASDDVDESFTGFLKVRHVHIRTVTWDLWRSN